MKKFIDIFSILLAFVLFISCADDEHMKPIQILSGTALSTDAYTISPIGGEFVVSFTCDDSWSLSGKPDWLEASKLKGQRGTHSVKFTAPLNDTRMERNAQMKFVTRDVETPLTISQEYPYLTLVGEMEKTFRWNDSNNLSSQPFVITVESNIAWKVDKLDEENSDAVSFKVSDYEGENDGILEIIPFFENIDKRYHQASYSVTPYVKNNKGEFVEVPEEAADRYIIKVNHQNLMFLVNDSVEPVSVEINQFNDGVHNLKIDAESPWTVTKCPSWVKLSAQQGQNTDIEVTADGISPTSEERSGIIEITSKAGAKREIPVIQEGYVFVLSSEDMDLSHGLVIENDDLGQKRLQLLTAGPWQIKNIPEWIELSPDRCLDKSAESTTHIITIKAKEQNLNFTDLSQTITITRSMKPYGVTQDVLDRNVKIEQKRFVFEVNPSPVLAAIPTMSTKPYDITISSSGDWYIDGLPEWINISEQSGNKCENKLLSVNANTINPDMNSDRSAEMTVVSKIHEDRGMDHRVTVKILQRRFMFELSDNSIDFPAYPLDENRGLTLISSAEWNVLDYPDWLSVTPESGDGMQDVDMALSAGVNSSKASRKGDLIITNTYNNKVIKAEIFQDAFLFDNTQLQKDNIAVYPTDIKIDFQLSGNAPWELQSGYDSWIRPSSLNGVANKGTDMATIIFKPEPNPLETKRTAHAKIKSVANGEVKALTFIQDAYVFDKTPLHFYFKETPSESYKFDVTSSGPWHIEGPSEYAVFSPSSGNSSTSVTITSKINTTLTERTADYKIISDLNKLERTIKFKQEKYHFDSTPVTLNFSVLNPESQSINIVCSGGWKLEGYQSWMGISKKSGSGNGDGIAETVQIAPLSNDKEIDRDVTIRFVSNDNSNLVKSVRIVQPKYQLDVDSNTLEYQSPIDTENKTIRVTSMSSWSAISDADWLKVISGSGTGNGTVIIQAEKNISMTDSRTANIIISNPHNSITESVVVKQPKFVFDVSQSKLSFNASGTSSQQVTVNCSDKWTVSSPDSWIQIKNVTAVGFSVIVNPNNGSEREGKIVISCQNTDIKKEINIEQSK